MLYKESQLWEPLCDIFSSTQNRESDSDVYRKWNICIKSYHISQDIVSKYLFFQTRISGILWTKEIEVPYKKIPEFYFNRVESFFHMIWIKKVVFSILPSENKILKQSSIEPSLLGTIVECPFVDGDTLLDVVYRLWEGNSPYPFEYNQSILEFISNDILKRINGIFEDQFHLNMSLKKRAPCQISGINIKILKVDQQKETLELLLTDIATDITEFVRLNWYSFKFVS